MTSTARQKQLGPEPVEDRVKRIIVVVPAYNEGPKVAETIEALKEGTQDIVNRGIEVLVYVVDDGSDDDTAEHARTAGCDRLLTHKVNRGLGAAIRTGLGAARDDGADVAIKFDSDFQHDPRDIEKIIVPIEEDSAEVVYGNRFERIEYKMPLVRRMGNRVFTRLMGWLTGWPLKDSQPGIFAVSRAYLANFYLPGDYNYTQQVLLDAFHKGMRFAHVNVRFRKRETGRSFVSFKYPFKVIPQILMVLVGVRPLRVFAPIGLLFIMIAVAVGGFEIAMFFIEDTAKPILHTNLVQGSFLFGVQTLFFGLIADLIVKQNRR